MPGRPSGAGDRPAPRDAPRAGEKAHWLFQHNPARGECGSGDWAIRRYRHLIAVGDDVALWLSGRDGGVAAVGTVTEAPRDEPGGPVIGVTFTRSFPARLIPREKLKADERFRDALVLRMAAGGNPFPLTAGQWRALADHVPPVAAARGNDAAGEAARSGAG